MTPPDPMVLTMLLRRFAPEPMSYCPAPALAATFALVPTVMFAEVRDDLRSLELADPSLRSTGVAGPESPGEGLLGIICCCWSPAPGTTIGESLGWLGRRERV